MQITDPIADMLTRIRNANSSKHESVNVLKNLLPKSRSKSQRFWIKRATLTVMK